MICYDKSYFLSDKLLKTITKASDWLVQNVETHATISNHLSVAAAACYSSYIICNNINYKKRGEELINIIKTNQSSEGWLNEYGGFDPGYETHSIFYLSTILEKNFNNNLLNIINKSISFFNLFILKNNSIGGAFTSRNTKFLLPAGFVCMTKYNHKSKEVLYKICNGLFENKIINIDNIDNQNLYPVLNNYLFSLDYIEKISSQNNSILDKPKESAIDKFFQNSGLYIKNNMKYNFVVNFNKGSVFTLVTQKNKHEDFGYIINLILLMF